MSLFDWFTGANPAASVAEGAVSGILGSVDKLIRDFHLPPEQELLWAQKRAELIFEGIKLEHEAVNSARQMQMTTRSVWPGTLSTLIIVGFSVMTGYIIKYGLPALDVQGSEALLMLIGTLNMGVGMVLQFWLGSSMGSQLKDQMMFRSKPSDSPKAD